MLKTIQTVSQQEASFLLWQHLGNLRVWYAFLSDNRRTFEKQDIGGHKLKPRARTMDGRDKSPRYVLRTVGQFIKDVKACTPGITPGVVTPMALDIDDTLTWKGNAFDRAGRPVRRKSAIYAGARSGTGYGTGARKPTISTRRGSGSAPYHH